MNILQPPGWERPRGYSNGIATRGTQVYVAGQIGWNANAQFDTDDLVSQIRQALSNIVSVLREAGGRPEHIVRMTWYVTDKQAYQAALHEIGLVYRDVIGRHFPVMSAIEVSALMEDRALVEIEATAVIPD